MRIIGIGVDIVEVDRVERIMERRPRFRERVFTPSEVAYCEERDGPGGCYAARWAAREACVKALGGIPGFRFHDVRVEMTPDGLPRLILDGSAKARADEIGVSDVMVSLAHERSVATAFCVAVGV